ncbi:hypothetical protein [Albimonas pacifica]|uniref:Uncharacterized protein n=1 Tax=Albimonas pacifica TaxID=1114924 RepID=A0A1I3KA06_9RHOB|nr:hypothetical protein [Albimonas pacifica]SFI69336.1 hypothetical protein SAMN05216258_108361 [Albimonas pacifica]
MASTEAGPRRGRSVRGAKISVAASFVLLIAIALHGLTLGLGQALGPDARMAGWIEALAARTDPDAAARLELFEIRRRFRDRVAQCTGVAASTWPVHLDDMPGRALLRHGSEAMPSLTVDFTALQASGLGGDFLRRGEGGEIPPERIEEILAAGLLGVFEPGSPCPPSAD